MGKKQENTNIKQENINIKQKDIQINKERSKTMASLMTRLEELHTSGKKDPEYYNVKLAFHKEMLKEQIDELKNTDTPKNRELAKTFESTLKNIEDEEKRGHSSEKILRNRKGPNGENLADMDLKNFYGAMRNMHLITSIAITDEHDDRIGDAKALNYSKESDISQIKDQKSAPIKKENVNPLTKAQIGMLSIQVGKSVAKVRERAKQYEQKRELLIQQRLLKEEINDSINKQELKDDITSREDKIMAGIKLVCDTASVPVRKETYEASLIVVRLLEIIPDTNKMSSGMIEVEKEFHQLHKIFMNAVGVQVVGGTGKARDVHTK